MLRQIITVFQRGAFSASDLPVGAGYAEEREWLQFDGSRVTLLDKRLTKCSSRNSEDRSLPNERRRGYHRGQFYEAGAIGGLPAFKRLEIAVISCAGAN